MRATSGQVIKQSQVIDELRQIRVVSVKSYGGYNRYEIRVVVIPINNTGPARILEADGPFYRPTTKSGRGVGPAAIQRLATAYL